jgi:two-component system, cell cycle sensor histidine kinase and response regulator CckA
MSERVSVHPPAVEQDPVRLSLDSLREGFQIIGFDWSYVYVNPAAARHGRRTPTELTGRSISEMYPGIERTALFESMRKCMAGRTTQLFENLFTFPDGSQRWFELRIQPVPSGICVYSSDIDDRKRRELTAGTSRPVGPASSLVSFVLHALGRH